MLPAVPERVTEGRSRLQIPAPLKKDGSALPSKRTAPAPLKKDGSGSVTLVACIYERFRYCCSPCRYCQYFAKFSSSRLKRYISTYSNNGSEFFYASASAQGALYISAVQYVQLPNSPFLGLGTRTTTVATISQSVFLKGRESVTCHITAKYFVSELHLDSEG